MKDKTVVKAWAVAIPHSDIDDRPLFGPGSIGAKPALAWDRYLESHRNMLRSLGFESRSSLTKSERAYLIRQCKKNGARLVKVRIELDD